MKKILFLISGLLTLSACVEMRDCTAKKNGGVVAYAKHEFGSGESCHDYYKIDSATALIVDDTKNEVRQKIGSPDVIEPTADGDIRWFYKDRHLELLFTNDYLKHWRKTE